MFQEVTAAVFLVSACPDVCDSSVSLFNVLLKLLKKVKDSSFSIPIKKWFMKTARQSVEEDSYTVSCWTVDRNKKKNRELPMTTVPLFKPNRFLSSFFFVRSTYSKWLKCAINSLTAHNWQSLSPPKDFFFFLKKYNLWKSQLVRPPVWVTWTLTTTNKKNESLKI